MRSPTVCALLLTVHLVGQDESVAEQRARWAAERRQTVLSMADPDPKTRLSAVLATRRGWPWPRLPWQLLAQTFDPERPHLPADLTWPTTPRARVEMWLAAARRCPDEREPYERQYPWRLGPAGQLAHDCLVAAAGEGTDAQVRLLEVAAAGDDELMRRRVMRMFVPPAPFGRTAQYWPVTGDARAQAPLLRLSLVDDDEVAFAALVLIEKVFARGATDEDLIRSVCDRARAALERRPDRLAFGAPGGPGCGNAIRFYGPIDDPDALLVAAASYAGAAAPQAQLVAHCEPFLREPSFGRPRSDFAWRMLVRNAPDLDEATRRRLDRLVVVRPPSSYRWDVESLRAALRGERAPRAPVPRAPHVRLTVTPPHSRAVLERLERLPADQPLAHADRKAMSQLLASLLGHSGSTADTCRALALSALWPERAFEHDWLCASTSEHTAIRKAAYEAMLTRDAESSELPWLVHETVFDPSPEVRALAGRAPR